MCAACLVDACSTVWCLSTSVPGEPRQASSSTAAPTALSEACGWRTRGEGSRTTTTSLCYGRDPPSFPCRALSLASALSAFGVDRDQCALWVHDYIALLMSADQAAAAVIHPPTHPPQSSRLCVGIGCIYLACPDWVAKDN